ncbi:M15 family metallopeptidase [Chitinophaga sp. Hz27]|uniref:M15 family metallopeptidase n=1 Tax=Chitinophaga sp. Hz27 TaxID=3347169 RepID=UPI0035DD18B3
MPESERKRTNFIAAICELIAATCGIMYIKNKQMAIFGERSINNLKGVHPNLVKVMTEAIKNTPIDFAITEGVRTIARQQKLYAQGRSRPGVRVTNADGIVNKSNHQAKSDGFGYAVDLYPCINGKVEINAVNELKTIAAHIKSVAIILNIPITWGGDWKSPNDLPHFELK